MPAGFDVAEELAASLGNRAGAWRFIQRFAEHWLTPLSGHDGCGEADLQAAEARLGVRLPAAIREAYALFGRRKDLTSRQDRLLDPHELAVDEIGEVLEFRRENQSVTSWGVPLTGLARPDPPVVFWLDAPASQPAGWRPFLDRFSLACVEIVLFESLFADPVELGDNRDLDEAAAALLAARFARLAMPDYPLWTGGGTVRWFTGADVILREDARTWLWARARTSAALDAVRATLPGEWLMLPG